MNRDVWPPPEILQKYYANDRFRGRTPEDDAHARSGLGHYCDLQSLNSEDALTFSFIGCLAYIPSEEGRQAIGQLFEILSLPRPQTPATVWLWRRLPHPEKLASTGGPEIDFGLLTPDTLVLGESKWNSGLGTGQGVHKNRTQLDLRLAYCSRLAPRALPTVSTYLVLGISRSSGLMQMAAAAPGITVINLRWHDLLPVYPQALQSELADYLAWKEEFSSPAV